MSLLGELREITQKATYNPLNDEHAVHTFEQACELCRKAAQLRDTDTKVAWDAIGLGIVGADAWGEEKIRRTRRGVVELLTRENLSVQEVMGSYLFIAWR